MKKEEWNMDDDSNKNWWIVWKEENGKIKLVSKSETGGMIPKGAYLTVDDEETKCKFILRVDDSRQDEPFEPSPVIIDMDLSGLSPDRQCKNIVTAYKVKTFSDRDDGLTSYIRPLCKARQSTQKEINDAMGSTDEKGPEVFVATVSSNDNSILKDNSKKLITARLPEDFFYYQTMICGRTGSGKTVAMKYLAQYFVEEKKGAVLAINVKEKDLLTMDQSSSTKNGSVLKEWKTLNKSPHGIGSSGTGSFQVYCPAAERTKKNITADTTPITLRTDKIEPDALVGALDSITEMGAAVLPDIFRHWRDDMKKKKKPIRFSDFISLISESEDRRFETKNVRDEVSSIVLHSGTHQSLIRCLNVAAPYFDNESARMLDWNDILESGKMSVIDVSGSTKFGALALRDILRRLVEAKNNEESSVDLLIIIDEVHQFYRSSNSRDALGDLDTICRTGRSMKIGVVFASQNPSDMPIGVSTVVNTKIFFRTDPQGTKDLGVKITSDELDGLRKGFAVASIYNLPQLKVLKFPMSYAGVRDESQ